MDDPTEVAERLKRATEAAQTMLQQLQDEQHEARRTIEQFNSLKKALGQAAVTRRLISAAQPFLFIVVAMFAWWLMVALANVALTNIPGGGRTPGTGPLVPPYAFSQVMLWIAFGVSGAAALVVATIAVYGDGRR
jgi:hypothetical protein